MNKLATILAGAMVLTSSLVPLNAARATDSLVTVWDTRGDWTGLADVATSDQTYNAVPVTLHISDQDELTTSGPMGTQVNVFVRGTITFAPPYGHSIPRRFAGSVDLKQGDTTTQRGKFALSGDFFSGELHAMSMTMNGVTTLTANGSITLLGRGVRNAPPAVARLGLTRQ
jgi:hypothetical protein